jgi:hypothetical protein
VKVGELGLDLARAAEESDVGAQAPLQLVVGLEHRPALRRGQEQVPVLPELDVHPRHPTVGGGRGFVGATGRVLRLLWLLLRPAPQASFVFVADREQLVGVAQELCAVPAAHAHSHHRTGTRTTGTLSDESSRPVNGLGYGLVRTGR